MWMVSVFCYPFLVTSAFVLSNSVTAFSARRLAAAFLYNLACSLAVACILRLARPRLAAWLVQCLLAFLALFTFVSAVHFLLFGQLLGLPSIYALLDTTPTESSEFAFSMLRRDHLFVALALTLPLLFSLARLARVSRVTFHRRNFAL